MYMTLVLQAHELAYYMWDLLERWGDCLNSQHRADGAKIMQTLKNCDIPVVSPGKSGESQTHLTEVRLYPQTLDECLMHKICRGGGDPNFRWLLISFLFKDVYCCSDIGGLIT